MELCNTFRQKYQNSSLHGSTEECDAPMAPTALELILHATHHYILHLFNCPPLTLTQNLAVKDLTYGNCQAIWCTMIVHVYTVDLPAFMHAHVITIITLHLSEGITYLHNQFINLVQLVCTTKVNLS